MGEVSIDGVEHPNHYCKPGHKECMVEMEEKYGAEAVYWFFLLSAFKYEYRAGDKTGESYDKDMAKAQQCKELAEQYKQKTIQNMRVVKDPAGREFFVSRDTYMILDQINGLGNFLADVLTPDEENNNG